MTDCTQYLATSAKNGELITRDGRVLVASKTDWDGLKKLVGGLIPAPHRPFGALDLLDDGTASEITEEELRAIVLAAIPDVAESDADAAATALHRRLYRREVSETIPVPNEP